MTSNDTYESPDDCVRGPRLPELSAPVIMKNVWYEIEKLKNAPSWQLTAGHSSETLAKYPVLTLVLVLMKATTRMGNHLVPGLSSVYLIQGRIEVRLFEGQARHLNAGEILLMDEGIPCEVHALEECAFLLTIAGIKGSI
jgi:quercetin dioxygenase-like cupin family protein